MAANRKILSLPGDGIGPEVMRQVGRVVEWFDKKRIASFDVVEDLVGGAAYDKYGTPLAEETMKKAQECDAVLFGAVGGTKWDSLPFAVKPERGLLRLRKEMDLFAKLRPALVFATLRKARGTCCSGCRSGGPASSSRTLVSPSSERRAATTEPADPDPMTT